MGGRGEGERAQGIPAVKIAVAETPDFLTKCVSPLDLSVELTAYHKNGLPKGDPTGWKTLDEHYTVLPGQWTLITGIPGHGKSEFLDALMMNLATRNGWVFSVFSPENQPHEIHVAKLMEKLMHKPFGDGPNERIQSDELAGGIAWMDDHFRFIKPHPELQVPSVRVIVDAAARFINEHDQQRGETSKHAIVIDPWNELEHKRPQNQSETEYISETLAYIRQFAREFSVHVFMVAHPRILHRDRDGKRPVPTPYDVSGSAHWFNKADNCITVWRETNPDVRTQEVKIYVQKVRFKNVGKPGEVTLNYDRITGTYHVPLGSARTYAGRNE